MFRVCWVGACIILMNRGVSIKLEPYPNVADIDTTLIPINIDPMED